MGPKPRAIICFDLRLNLSALNLVEFKIRSKKNVYEVKFEVFFEKIVAKIYLVDMNRNIFENFNRIEDVMKYEYSRESQSRNFEN